MKIYDVHPLDLARIRQLGSPTRCLLLELVRTDLQSPGVLRSLLKAFINGVFTPYFSQQVIDQLFTNEVLKYYAGGRYYNHLPLNSVHAWNDLVNNLLSPVRFNLEYLKGERTEQERQETINDVRSEVRKLKIVEDWLYYHPEEQVKLQAILADEQKQLSQT